MNLIKMSVGCTLLLCILFISGCINQGTTTEITFENIEFESDVVELADAYLDYDREEMYDDYGELYYDTRAVNVKYILHNPQDRFVSVNVSVYLYDANDSEIYSEGPYIINLLKGYTERGVNTVTYDGTDVNAVEYAKIVAFEIKTT